MSQFQSDKSYRFFMVEIYRQIKFLYNFYLIPTFDDSFYSRSNFPHFHLKLCTNPQLDSTYYNLLNNTSYSTNLISSNSLIDKRSRIILIGDFLLIQSKRVFTMISFLYTVKKYILYMVSLTTIIVLSTMSFLTIHIFHLNQYFQYIFQISIHPLRGYSGLEAQIFDVFWNSIKKTKNIFTIHFFTRYLLIF